MHKSFELMGRPVRDVVTGFTGIADSICFDLYGCIQASVRPTGLDYKGGTFPANWYDVKRLVALGDPVMALPDFTMPEIGSATKAAR